MRLVIPKQYNSPWESRVVLHADLAREVVDDRRILEYRLTVDEPPVDPALDWVHRERDVFAGSDMRSAVGEKCGPKALAVTLLSIWSAYGESLSLRGEESQYWDECTPEQRDFLIGNYERLAMAVDTWRQER